MFIDHAEFVENLVASRVPPGVPLQMQSLRTTIDFLVVTCFSVKSDQ